MPTAVVDADVPFDRDALLAGMRADGIDARVFFWPLTLMPAFAAHAAGAAARNRHAYGLYGRAFNLPSYQDLSEAGIERVASHVRARLATASLLRKSA